MRGAGSNFGVVTSLEIDLMTVPAFLAGPQVTPADVRAAYRPQDYERLAELKTRWDPSNTFRFNKNILPNYESDRADVRGGLCGLIPTCHGPLCDGRSPSRPAPAMCSSNIT
jgi:hypothetical protein